MNKVIELSGSDSIYKSVRQQARYQHRRDDTDRCRSHADGA